MSSPRHPFPIVVSVPRSGSTMLRLMLDSHPELAIPPETGFLLSPQILAAQHDHDLCARLITGFPDGAPAWNDYGIDASGFLDAARHLAPTAGLADVLRLFYATYAERHAKKRTGDKTPLYVTAMPTVASVLPEARFIHIVRDGRDVALSWSKTWFAPSRDLAVLVAQWSAMVREARREAPAAKYLEIRYEDLVRTPETVLRRVCAFIDLDYTDRMLDYPDRAAGRLAEHQARWASDGTLLVSQPDRFHQQWRTTRPPLEERIGVWRTEMSPADLASCNQAAAGLLDDA
ncbi:MAG: sulfotransferase [Devosia sp.]|uniref:sulfotransferase family protein n=1 Tax=Devosia sp. TaxID=1871048 RepID=UPI001A4AB8D6|nr:sulfotransferase [Devosia sp.]MBL8599774.1 sulfotransferase [Devosia sp.]